MTMYREYKKYFDTEQLAIDYAKKVKGNIRQLVLPEYNYCTTVYVVEYSIYIGEITEEYIDLAYNNYED